MSIVPTFKAIQWSSSSGQLEIITKNVVPPVSGQALIRVLAYWVAPPHKYMFSGAIPFIKPHNHTPGGGCIGRVEAVGPDSLTLTLGQLVYVDPSINGRDAPEEKIVHGTIPGWTPRAEKLGTAGWKDGVMTEKVLAPIESVIAVDEKFFIEQKGYSIEKIFVLNRFVLPYAAYELAKLQPGDTVIVAFATGELGNAAVELALALGAASVIGIGRDQRKLDQWKSRFSPSQASRISAVAVSGDVDADASFITASTPKGAGADLFFDLTPPQGGSDASSHITSCIWSLKTKARVVFMGGISRGVQVSMPYFDIVHKDLQMYGSFMYDLSVPRKVLRLVESGILSLDNFETKVFQGLERFREAMDFAATEKDCRLGCFVAP
ncbi:hypothetical protein DL93DRAFT_2201532 [Clavulina sp. PMI_390]|nr:hypothetical protein DL93DRAFT_2201532 [Clavulina sp. PMI_390]